MTREFTLDVNGESFVVTVRRDGDRLIVERDGQKYSVTVVATSAGSPATGDPAAGAGHSDRPGAARPSPGGASASGGASAIAGPARATTGASGSAAAGAVCAPMVGVVREIHAKPGDRVSAGDLVITMEAMKMEIYVTAPIDGVVESVSCAPGDSAADGATLAMIAGAGGAAGDAP